MEAVYGFIAQVLGDEQGGVGPDYADIGYAPSTDAVHGVAIVFVGPLDAEEVYAGVGFGLVDQERSFAGSDFDMDGAGASENPDKIRFAIQIFGSE